MNGWTAQALLTQAQAWLRQGKAAWIVSVEDIQGSTPRDVGARMLVSAEEVIGTIGGGHLEWQAIDKALTYLRPVDAPSGRAQPQTHRHTFALGPTLGQCCGGVVSLAFTPLSAHALQGWPVPEPRFHLELHGAGHVGQAIVKLLTDIDCTVRWIDERVLEPGDALSELNASNQGAHLMGLPSQAQWRALPRHITPIHTEAADLEVRDAPPACAHLILTHRHDLDLRIAHAVLRKGDAAFVGMIGSRTKEAKFRHRLRDMGLSAPAIARMTCPIGLGDIAGKEPAVIAISVVAQLLQRFPPQAKSE